MAISTCPVDCTCHTSSFAVCSVPGGCGSAGCGRTEQAGTCPTCKARDPETGLVCEPCRRWLPTALHSIPGLYARLHDELIPSDDSASRPVLICSTCGLTVPHTPEQRYARHEDHPEFDDPDDERRHAGWVGRHLIHHAGGPAESIAPDIIVTGGDDEAPVPIDLHIADLLGAVIRDGGRTIDVTGDNWVPRLQTSARTLWVDNGHKGRRETIVLDRKPARDANGRRVMIPARDQIGVVPVAQVIDQEVRAWVDAGAPGSRWRPTATIPVMVAWLDVRLNWACDNYRGIDVFAAMLQRVRGQMMGALGEFDPEPERCDGVPCNRCDLLTLFRRQDGTGDIDCHNPDCRKVFSAEQYRDLAKHAASEEREQLDPAEIATLLRRRTSQTADLRRV